MKDPSASHGETEGRTKKRIQENREPRNVRGMYSWGKTDPREVPSGESEGREKNRT